MGNFRSPFGIIYSAAQGEDIFFRFFASIFEKKKEKKKDKFEEKELFCHFSQRLQKSLVNIISKMCFVSNGY